MVVDVSDTTMAVSGTNKKMTRTELITGLGVALASDLSNHLSDTADAHDASAISVTPTGAIAATDVQAALAELDTEKAASAHSHSTALDDLSDVTITTPSNGQVLKFNGSAWVNDTDATGGGGGALDDLTDVTITAAATGDLLRYNGSAWVDYPDSNYAASAHNHAASAITSGTIDTARLGSGTANSSTYLRGDQTWASVAAGSFDPQAGNFVVAVHVFG